MRMFLFSLCLALAGWLLMETPSFAQGPASAAETTIPNEAADAITGIVLIIAGSGFLIAEAFLPTMGLLGLAGVGAILWGIVLVFDPSFSVLLILGALGVAMVGALAFFMAKALSKNPEGEAGGLAGETAEIVEWFGMSGRVKVMGQVWRAYSDTQLDLKPQDLVHIGKVEPQRLKIIQS